MNTPHAFRVAAFLVVQGFLLGCGSGSETPVGPSSEPISGGTSLDPVEALPAAELGSRPTVAPPSEPASEGTSSAPAEAPSGPEPSAEPGADDPRLACLGASTNRAWGETLALLDRLAGMNSPFTPGDPPVRCMTDVWAASDPGAGSLERALVEDFERTEEARHSAWLAALPRNAVWLRVFVPGVSRATVRGEVVTFDALPGLSARSASLNAEIGGPQHCAVLAAELDGSNTVLWCGRPGSTREEAAFRVVIEEPAVRARLGALAVGDVVRFGEQLSLVGEIPRGESEISSWTFGEVPASGVEVVARGTCCRR